MAEKRIIGIDFTNTEMRLVEVVQKGKGAVLEHFAVGEIPAGVFSAGKVVEVDRLRSVIKDLLTTHRFKGKKAILGVSGKFGVTRLITLPKMNLTQTRDAIQLQLSQYVPFSPGDTSYDYKVLREIKEEEQLQQEILLAATRRSMLQGLLQAVRKAGLTVMAVKITTLSSYSLFESEYFDADQAVGFCDVRDNVTDISFVGENLFRLSRSVEFGAASIIEAVRRKLGGSNEETLEYLQYNPVDLTEVFASSAEVDADIGGLAGVTQDEPRAKIVRDAVIRVLSTYVNELMRSIRYFESQQKRRARVGKVVIFGNISFLKNLEPYIAEQTGLDIRVIHDIPELSNALSEIDQRLYHDHAPEGVVAAALAYDAATSKRLEYNLMPREALVRRKTVNALKYVAGLYIIMVAVALAYYAQKYQVAEDYKAEIRKTDNDLQKVAPYFTETENLKAEINKVAPKVEGVMSITKKMFPWETLTKELAYMTGDYSWVSEFSFDSQAKELVITASTFKLSNFMAFWVSLHNSQIYSVTEEKIDIDLPDIPDDGGPAISPGSGGGGGGGGRSADPPSGGFGIFPSSNRGGASFGGMQQMGNSYKPPDPYYGLPQQPGGIGDITDFWRGRQQPFLVIIGGDHTFAIRDEFLKKQEDIYPGLDSLKVN